MSIHKATRDGSLAFFDKTLLEKRPSQLDMKLSIPAIFSTNSSKSSTTESEVSTRNGNSRTMEREKAISHSKERTEVVTKESLAHGDSHQDRSPSIPKVSRRRSVSHRSIQRHRSHSPSHRSTSRSDRKSVV